MNSFQNQEDNWQNNILNDLAYIKTKRRYRWKNGMKAPLYVAAGLIIVYLMLFLAELLWTPSHNKFTNYFLPFTTLIIVLFSVVHYLRSLQFTAIETGLATPKNRQLISAFLQEKQLLIYEHPQCPDIIQIFSRPVNINSEQREVMVFIAAENRILINSHFTENRWWILLQKRHGKAMAKGLEQYIANNKHLRQKRR